MEDKENLQKGKVLIVDDNPKNLQVLGGTLRANNYFVEFSTNGQGAIHWLESETFDLVLLDVMMPDLDGFETCKKIRNELKNTEIPIIFLTAKTDKESILKGFKVGAQDYITKPFDSSELLARVSTHLELNQARQKLQDVNAYLEKEVEKRTFQLNQANKELSELDKIKGEFLNMLSHEIRTPLNGIKGSLQLLKVRIENEDLVQLINILDSSVIRLESFSYSALLITRLKSKKFKTVKSTVFLKDELDFCLLPESELILSKKLIIKSDEMENNLELHTDKELFHELFVRILQNAIKYSPDESTVEILTRRIGGKIQIQITDEGNGFPDKILHQGLKLFNPGEIHVNKNMGLNLYLAELVAQYLGGSMEISNIDGGGAQVLINVNAE